MPQRDGSTPDVHLRGIDAELLRAVHCHAGERLVELDDVDVREAEAVLAQQLGDGERGADAHDAGRQPRDGGADVLGEDGLPHGERGGALHQEEGGRAVRDLARVAARGAVAVIRERRADLAQGVICGSPTRAFVFRHRHRPFLARFRVFDDGGDGHDFVVEPARFLGALGPLVGFGGEAVLRFARDVEVFADVLRGLAHGLHAVDCVLGAVEDLFVEGLRGTGGGGHGFGADGDAAVDAAEADLVGDVLGGFEARGAEAIHG